MASPTGVDALNPVADGEVGRHLGGLRRVGPATPLINLSSVQPLSESLRRARSTCRVIVDAKDFSLSTNAPLDEGNADRPHSN